MQNDDLEKLLQAGLNSYGDAEPLAGLEERVLRRVQEKRLRSRWLWFRWAGATACACLLLAVIFGNVGSWPVHRQEAKGVQSTTADVRRSRPSLVDLHTPSVAGESLQQPKIVHARREKSVAAKQSEPRPKSLPKLNLFPTPHPLTAEEQALVKFVKEHPEEAQQLVDAERRIDEPIQIAAIHIEPLKIDGP